MAGSITTSKSFRNLVKARQTYRQKLEDFSFPAYSEVVTPALHNTSGLEAIVRNTQSVSMLAVQQHALDYIIASKRAVDMRNKRYLDYVRDAKGARPQFDTYEDGRVARYESYQF